MYCIFIVIEVSLQSDVYYFRPFFSLEFFSRRALQISASLHALPKTTDCWFEKKLIGLLTTCFFSSNVRTREVRSTVVRASTVFSFPLLTSTSWNKSVEHSSNFSKSK